MTHSDEIGIAKEHARIWAASKQSTCQKRVVVCALYDEDNNLLATGYNQCYPPMGLCPRLNVTTGKAAYDATANTCGSTHAEIDALDNLASWEKPVRADVYGHDFACASCETALKARGVTTINIITGGFGTGLVRP